MMGVLNGSANCTEFCSRGVWISLRRIFVVDSGVVVGLGSCQIDTLR